MTTNRYSAGYEWSNQRGQVFVQQGADKYGEFTHPYARKDGFVPRAKLVLEVLLPDGMPEGMSYEDYAITPESRLAYLRERDLLPPDGELNAAYLLPGERVLHLDEDASNDDPENLMLFPTQGALAQWRSQRYKERKKQDDKATLDNFAAAARTLRQRRHDAAMKGAMAAKAAREKRAAEEKAEAAAARRPRTRATRSTAGD